MVTVSLERLVFPGTILALEILFIVVFGALVEYDDAGGPLQATGDAAANGSENESETVELESSRSTIKTYPFFQDVHVMIFVGFGFLMTFMRRYGFGSIGFNLLLASLAIQWYTICSGLFTFIDQAHADTGESLRIRVGLETLVTADFSAAAVLITFGALLGKATPFQLIFIAVIEVICYSANEALNLHVFQAADVGGSMIIHTFGAYFGLAASAMLYKKKAYGDDKNSSVYHSDLFAMIGTLFLWMFWPSFNGALASGNAQYRAVINTYYAMTGSVLASFIVSMCTDKKQRLSMTHVQNATLAGGVAIGSIADMLIQPYAAIVVGFLSGMLSVIGYKLLSPTMDRWFYLQDTCGVHNLHGLPGVFSAVASAIAAGIASFSNYMDSLYVVFPARDPSDGDRSAGTQAGFQLALLASTLFISILGGLVAGLIVRLLPFLKGGSTFFDDSVYWELPDDADKYLPLSNPPDNENTPIEVVERPSHARNHQGEAALLDSKSAESRV